ncbi:MAG: hypothetical protein HQ472_10855 [Ignavibacteria bacterium]|nr:hypothetical protein [Ignavibacteria bacterium]
MAWIDGDNAWMSIAPYMNRRQPVGANMSRDPQFLATYKLNDSVRFRFGIRSAAAIKPTAFILTLNGRYGDGNQTDHYGVLWLVLDAAELIGANVYATLGDMNDALNLVQIGVHHGSLDDNTIWLDGAIVSNSF